MKSIEQVGIIIALGTSVTAVVVSMLNLFLSKKQMYTTIITTNRMEWIGAVRLLLWEFIDFYIDKNGTIKDLQSKKNHIDLYLNTAKNPDQFKLSNTLQRYVETRNLDTSELINVSMEVLANAWKRMKIEAGSPKMKEKAMHKKIYDERSFFQKVYRKKMKATSTPSLQIPLNQRQSSEIAWIINTHQDANDFQDRSK